MSEENERSLGKHIIMPERAEMVEKLREANVYGIAPQTDEFFDSLIRKLAGSSKVGQGLAIAWVQSEYDVLRNLPPVMTPLVRMRFNDVIDAITPDAEVAQDAKTFWQEAIDATNKDQ